MSFSAPSVAVTRRPRRVPPALVAGAAPRLRPCWRRMTSAVRVTRSVAEEWWGQGAVGHGEVGTESPSSCMAALAMMEV
jgi:hypothetical protein